MERGLVKLTWIFSTQVAHVLFVNTAGKVKGGMERPLLKYASTANARCSHVQSMIGTGCAGYGHLMLQRADTYSDPVLRAR